MRRRTLLAGLAGGLTAVAGCINTDSANTDDPTDSPTRTSTGTPTPEDLTPTPTQGSDVTVSVSDVRVQHGIVIPTSPDSIGITGADTQYLIASVSVDGSLHRDALALAVGDDEFEPTTLENYYHTSWGGAEWYTNDGGDGLVLFEGVEGASGDDAALTWPGGEWSFGDAVGNRLGQEAPEFSVQLKSPETHDSESPPPLHLDVTNESDRIGPRVAYTPVEAISEVAPAGETTTVEIVDDWTGLPPENRIGDGEPDVTYNLDYLGGEASAEIHIVESTPE